MEVDVCYIKINLNEVIVSEMATPKREKWMKHS